MVVGSRRTFTGLALAVVAVMVAAACGGGGGGNEVRVTEKDFSITLNKSSMKTGEITFSVKNDGPSVHEFVIFDTDLAADQLPTTQDENGVEIVDEEGEGVSAVDEIEDIAVGSTQELKVTLEPGTYVMICNLPAHYQQGMRTSFTVTS
jgi:uncharacterized cupredoxin-like copper-binding protein